MLLHLNSMLLRLSSMLLRLSSMPLHLNSRRTAALHLVLIINRRLDHRNQSLLSHHQHPGLRHPRTRGRKQGRRHAREKKSGRPGKPTKKGGTKLLVDFGSSGKRRHGRGNNENRTRWQGNSGRKKRRNEKPRKRRDYSKKPG
jgi:hypothetical protein